MKKQKEKLSKLSFLKIKKSWNEITISNFRELRAIQEDPILNDLNKRYQILGLASGKNDKYFNDFPLSETRQLYDSLTFLNDPISADLSEYYYIGGKKYKLLSQIDEQSYGIYIYLQEYSKNEKENLNNIHKILSTVLIPVKPLRVRDKIYNALYKATPVKVKGWLNMSYREGITEDFFETPLEDTANNIYDNLDIASAQAIKVFFCLLQIAFAIHTKTYLEQELNRRLESALKNLKENPGMKNLEQEIMKIQTAVDSLKTIAG